MAVQNMAWQWGWASDDRTATVQVNFAPTDAVAECSLSQADGEGVVACGITQYRTRATPRAPDEDHDFGRHGGSYWLLPMAFDHLMTSVTAAVDTADDQQGTMTLMVSLFG